jgi:hypothetical protein
MEFCNNPNCKNDAHWPGGCSEQKRRVLDVDIGAQRVAPRSRRALAAEHAAAVVSIIGPTNFAAIIEKASRGFSGNNFTPCDKCGKPTRGQRCFKCST